MKPINMLYNLPVRSWSGVTREFLKHMTKYLSKKTNIQINLDIFPVGDLLDKLRANPNYDLIVLHLSYAGQEGIYKKAEICRKLSNNPILVAESDIYPNGKKEVLEHFDGYTGLLFENGHLEDLFTEFGFIPKENELSNSQKTRN